MTGADEANVKRARLIFAALVELAAGACADLAYLNGTTTAETRDAFVKALDECLE